MQDENNKRHWLTDRPVANFVVFLALVVFGAFSLRQLPVELMPELTYPTLTVRTEYPGTAPQEVENEISRPLEEALGVVPGLSKIKSISRSGVSDVVLEFVWGIDMDKATQEVLEKMDRVFLPRDAESPLILHFDPSLDPIMELSLSGDGEQYQGESGLRRLRRIGELQIKRELERIKGVAAVRVRGGLEEEFHVLLEKDKLERVNLSIAQIIEKIQTENINMPGGLIKEGKAQYMIRAINEYENVEQIADTVVFRNGNREVRVKDIGSVKRTHKEKELITRTDGRESVQIDIYKEADANIVEIANKVKDRVGKVTLDENGKDKPGQQNFGFGKKTRLAEKLQREETAYLAVTTDRSLFIKSSIDEVRNTAVIGGLLAITVLLMFLKDAKSTAIIGLSIPISLLITFAPMNLTDVSINIMSLGGLAMGIGMLVDSSIVVLESIFRCREEGDSNKVASIRGAKEVRGAVIASTLTSVAVFFPMVFVEGLAGQAFFDLGLAVVFSLSASLLVAVFFIPMLASRGGVSFNDQDQIKGIKFLNVYSWNVFQQSLSDHTGIKRLLLAPYFLIRFVLGFVLEFLGKIILLTLLGTLTLAKLIWMLCGKVLGWVLYFPFKFSQWLLERGTSLYTYLLKGCLHSAYLIIPVVALCFFGLYLMSSKVSSELLPEIHQGEVTFEVSLPIGTPIEVTDEVMVQVEKAILEDKDEIENLIVSVGYDVSNMQRSDEGEHSTKFKILLKPTRNPKLAEDAVVSRVRTYLEPIPDVDFRVVRPVLFSSQTPIEIEIYGNDLRKLRDISDQAVESLSDVREISDVEPLLKPGAPEIQIVYDRDQIVRFGLNIQTVANQIKSMVQGAESTKFNLKDRRIPIMVRLQESDRSHVDHVEELTISNPRGENIKISSLAQIRQGEGPSEIRRIDGNRSAVIQANLGEGSLSQAAGAISKSLQDNITWPDGMGFQITGQNEEWQESQKSLFLALGLSIFLVYVIMAAQFESLLQPLLIMLTIPLAFIGTFIGLFAFNTPISIVVMLGMIMLAGIVVNNAIVLVDYANKLRFRGHDLKDAIITSSRVRFRPILMSTLTTILGLLPMALFVGDGAEIRTPMALAVMTGLMSSTFLTLFIIPSLYFLLEKMLSFFKVKTETTPNIESPIKA